MVQPVRPRALDARRYNQRARRALAAFMGRILLPSETQPLAILSVAELTAITDAVNAEAVELQKYHTGRWSQTVRRINLSVLASNPEIVEYMERWSVENAALIRTIPPRAAERVAQITADPRNLGDRRRLNQLLRREQRLAGYNLRRITRDQTSKAIGRLTEIRHKEVGIQRYIWQTAGDERVRPTHNDLDNTLQRWDSPPSPGHPGNEILCRCVAIPYLQDDPATPAEPEEEAPAGMERGPVYSRVPTPPTGTRYRATKQIDRYRENSASLEARLLQREGLPTEDALEAAQEYSGIGYLPFNSRLRTGIAEELPDYLTTADVDGRIRDLSAAIQASQTTRNVRLFRGVSGEYADDLWRSARVGGDFTDAGFVSVSSQREVAVNFAGTHGPEAVVMNVLTPKGTRAFGMNLSNATNLPEEAELILQRGTRFRVLRKSTPDGVRTMDVEVVSQGWQRTP